MPARRRLPGARGLCREMGLGVHGLRFRPAGYLRPAEGGQPRLFSLTFYANPFQLFIEKGFLKFQLFLGKDGFGNLGQDTGGAEQFSEFLKIRQHFFPAGGIF